MSGTSDPAKEAFKQAPETATTAAARKEKCCNEAVANILAKIDRAIIEFDRRQARRNEIQFRFDRRYRENQLKSAEEKNKCARHENGKLTARDAALMPLYTPRNVVVDDFPATPKAIELLRAQEFDAIFRELGIEDGQNWIGKKDRLRGLVGLTKRFP